MVGNRATAGKASPLASQFFVAIIAAPLLVLATVIGGLSGTEKLAVSLPDWTIVARCAVVALTASTAHWAIYQGTVRAGASSSAPTSYVQLLVASLLGAVVFGNLPDGMTLLGAAMIVAAGLWLWSAGRNKAA